MLSEQIKVLKNGVEHLRDEEGLILNKTDVNALLGLLTNWRSRVRDMEMALTIYGEIDKEPSPKSENKIIHFADYKKRLEQ